MKSESNTRLEEPSLSTLLCSSESVLWNMISKVVCTRELLCFVLKNDRSDSCRKIRTSEKRVAKPFSFPTQNELDTLNSKRMTFYWQHVSSGEFERAVIRSLFAQIERTVQVKSNTVANTVVTNIQETE